MAATVSRKRGPPTVADDPPPVEDDPTPAVEAPPVVTTRSGRVLRVPKAYQDFIPHSMAGLSAHIPKPPPPPPPPPQPVAPSRSPTPSDVDDTPPAVELETE